MKPYQQIPIEECGEPLVLIPTAEFAVVTPHPYQAIGAPYSQRSPYWLRQSVVTALLNAQVTLQQQRSGWRIQIFDAYRPISVQQFMVDYTAQELARQQGQEFSALSASLQAVIMSEVYQFWALPSLDPHTPPPHSTGAAVDITLVDAAGQVVDMGSPIDEVSERSHPDYFQQQSHPSNQIIHIHRMLLRDVMDRAGFAPHPNEWWHFSLGDQLWAWQLSCHTGEAHVARYGWID
jgi:D-alanyl-D-alanine dipeptidase